MEQGRQITVDAAELQGRWKEFEKLVDQGVTVVITEAGKVTARMIPADPGPPPRRHPKLKFTPRQRTGPRYIPPPLGEGLGLAPERIDQITREAR
jgi:antitoxin (DNA-binding transcriptional repressor) of toxin-antitoxin stability system